MDLLHSVEESNSHPLREKASDPFVQSDRSLLLHVPTFFLILRPFSVIFHHSNTKFSSDNRRFSLGRTAGDVDNAIVLQNWDFSRSLGPPLYDRMSLGVCGRKRKRDSL